MKVVSGGQTGADRAGLDAAMVAGLSVGGWCPQGRRAEDGPIPDRFPLRETPAVAYRVWTQGPLGRTTSLTIHPPPPPAMSNVT